MKRLFLIIFLLHWSKGADHNMFKTCDRVEFCRNFRNRAALNVYTVNPESVLAQDSAVTFTLREAGSGRNNLTVSLSGIVGNTFRLKIKDSVKRYEVHDVLDGEPVPLKFDKFEKNTTAATITSANNTIRIHYNPFSIEFAHNNVSEVIFDGDRLSMTSNNVNAPFTFGVTFPQAAQLYGLHEHADNLALQTTKRGGVDPYRLKNSDLVNYELKSPMAMYGAVPFLYGHSVNATAGIFLLNAAEQWIELNSQAAGSSQAYFAAEMGIIDLFVFLGPKPSDVLFQYVSLTGKAHLPPLWALGYHQSRFSYGSQDDVRSVLANFDKNRLPLDAIWLDIDYTDAYRFFTWNTRNFSDPIGLQKSIDSQKRKMVTLVDPHLKAETGYKVYDAALKAGLFVKTANGSVFKGNCWPGVSTWMDFMNPAARDFHGDMYSYENFVNSTRTIGGIWNDMNEPSVFDAYADENTLPADALHFGNIRHREIHNIYGFLQTMATHKGLLKRDNGTIRPFILTRSHFAGSQRYAAIWTGDNTADWGYIGISIAQCLTANLMGIVFCGADVGGFFGNPNPEVFQRFYQTGAWLPFFRGHSASGTQRREPYLFSPEVQNVVRNALEMRYRHLPVWYTLFYEHVRNGDPILRPLFYQYNKDPNAYRIDNQFLVGTDILVRPVTEAGAKAVSIYFPGGAGALWVAAEGNAVYTGRGFVQVSVTIESVPVYYRRGSVIVRKETPRPTSTDMLNDAHTLVVILDTDNKAHGTVYLDDNSSFQYRDNKLYNYIQIDVDGTKVTTRNIDGAGNFKFTFDKVVYKNVTQLPQEGNAGTIEEYEFTTDAEGKFLKDLRQTFGGSHDYFEIQL